MTSGYSDLKHFHSCSSSLVRYKDNLQFCDVTLNVKGVDFPAHKVILAMFCPYFESLFDDNNAESQDKVVELNDLDPVAFESVLNFIYTGQIEQPPPALAEVYKIADYLQLDELKFSCFMIMTDSMPIDQCVAVIKLTETHHLPGILEEALLVFGECLDEICETDGFLELDFDEAIKLLNTCQSTEKQARNLFKASMSWLNHDLKNRQKHLQLFLNIIPVQCVTRSVLDNIILKERLIRKNVEATNWLLEHFPVVKIDEKKSDESARTISTLYIPSKYKKIFVKHSRNEFVSFEVVSEEFRRLAPVPTMQDFKPVAYKDDVFLFGGIGSEHSYTYQLEKQDWKSIPFPSYSSSETPCVIGDSVIFTGGYFNEGGYNSVCKYNFHNSIVEYYPNLNFDRSLYGVAANDNFIFVCGGMNYSLRNSPKLRHVEGMDLREGKWTILHPMEEVQGPCTATYITDSLYVSNTHSGRIERFDTRAAKWEPLTDAPWGSGVIVAFDNKLYRVYSKGVAEYNFRMDHWKILGKFEFDSPEAVTF